MGTLWKFEKIIGDSRMRTREDLGAHSVWPSLKLVVRTFGTSAK